MLWGMPGTMPQAAPKRARGAERLLVLFITPEGEDVGPLLAQMRRAGFDPEPLTARDAPTATRILKQKRVGAIVHLAQPGLPNLGWVLRSAQTAPSPQPPVISLVSTHEEGMAAMELGADHYVTRDGMQCLGPTLRREIRLRAERHRWEQALQEATQARQREYEEGRRQFGEQAAMLQAIFAAAPVGITFYDPQLRCLQANEAAARIAVRPEASELLGRGFHELVAEHLGSELADRLLAEVLRAKEQGEQRELRELTVRVPRLPGETFYIDWSVRPVTDSAGRLLGMLITFHDATARVRDQQALRASEANYRAIFDGANDALLVLDDHTGRILDANRRAERMFGYGRQALARMGIEQLLPSESPSAAEQVREWIARARQDGPQQVEWRACNRKGERFWAEVSLKRVTLGGRRRILAAVRDITKRKQALESLERERAFLTAAFDIMPFPLGVANPQGERILTNRSTGLFFGEDRIPQEIAFLTPDTHTPMPRERWPFYRPLHGETIRGVEGIIAFPDGREVPVLVYGAPVYVGQEMVGVVWSVQDISALKEADRAKDEFLAVLSHELVTPLANIVGWTQAARREAALRSQALEVIERNAERQRRILDDLVATSRLLHGKLFISPQRTDLWHLAEQAVEDILPDARDRGLNLVLEPPPGTLPVRADPGRMRQVIGNLLENAYKFTEPGGTIVVAGGRHDGWAEVSVRDTGRGIPASVLPTLFQPFRQYRRTEGMGGLGLGLSLVKGIVELHQGWVRAESPGLGQGSTFTIGLPLAGEERPPAASPGGPAPCYSA